MNLSGEQIKVLRALADGWALKSHRYLDGVKVYKLHPLDGPTHEVAEAVMDFLKTQQLIDSNKKFPAATYLLTDAGRRLISSLAKSTR